MMNVPVVAEFEREHMPLGVELDATRKLCPRCDVPQIHCERCQELMRVIEIVSGSHYEYECPKCRKHMTVIDEEKL